MSRRSPKETRKPDPGTYVVIGLYPSGAAHSAGPVDPAEAASSGARLMAVDGKIVLFDTVEIAQQWIPQLGMGRQTHFSRDGETAYWTPMDPNGINRAVLLTGYNPHSLPPNMPGGILSETLGREWRHHVMWSAAFYDVGQILQKKDGSLINTALRRDDGSAPSLEVATRGAVLLGSQ